MEAYTSFAEVYDQIMDNVPYREWADFLQEILQKGEWHEKQKKKKGAFGVHSIYAAQFSGDGRIQPDADPGFHRHQPDGLERPG